MENPTKVDITHYLFNRFARYKLAIKVKKKRGELARVEGALVDKHNFQ